MVVFGLGAGTLDAAGNAYVAVREGNRQMGAIHGLFGVGAILGPLVVTGLIAIGFAWRASFFAVGVAYGATAALLILHARPLAIPTKRSTGETGRLALSWQLFWSLAIFVVYAGIAASTGVWAFTFLTEYKGVADGLGGVIVAGYWAAFAGSRFVFASIGDRFLPHALMRLGLLGAVAGYGLFWVAPWPGLAVAALLFAGFSHGPFFPIQMLETSARFGSVRAPGVIGFQIAGINIGGAVIPAAVGVLVGWFDLAVVPPSLVVFAVLTFVVSEVLNRADSNHVLAPSPAPNSD
jgi:fucose permease